MHVTCYTAGRWPQRSRVTMICLALATVFAAALPGAGPPAARAQDAYPYTFVDVGTLGGPQTYHNFPGTMLNNRGMLALFGSDIPALDPHHATPELCFNPTCHLDHAAIWHNGRLIDLGAFPGPTSSGLIGMSPSGVYAAGLSTDGTIDSSSGVPVFRGALFTGGQVIDLGTFGGPFSSASDVNNQGQVVGVAQTALADPFDDDQGLPQGLPGPRQDRAFVWHNGTLQDLGTLGGTQAAASFINERGQIAGASFTTVVEGRIRFFVDGQATDVEPGGAAYLPRGSRHWYRNVGTTPSRQWIVTTTPGFEHFFARCADEFANPGGPDMAQIVAIHQEYGITLLDDGTHDGTRQPQR